MGMDQSVCIIAVRSMGSSALPVSSSSSICAAAVTANATRHMMRYANRLALTNQRVNTPEKKPSSGNSTVKSATLP